MKERNMYSIIVSTCCCLWITMVQVLDGKPYAGKRLSYEGMDWNFGGWTPIDGGGGGGFTGMSSLAHHPTLTQHFSSSPSSSSSSSLGLLNSNDPSSVMESDMIQFLKNVPSSVTPPPELHGLDLQTLPKQQQQQHHHHPQQPSSSIVSQVNDSPSSSLRALRFIQQQSPIQHQQPVAPSSSWPSLLPVNSNNNHNNVSGNLPSSSSQTHVSAPAPSSSSMSYAVAHDAPTKIRVEPKPLRQAQIEAYRVIEQLESDAEKQKQVLSAQGPTYLPLDIPSSSDDSYNRQGQAMSYNVASSNAGESRRKSNAGYGNSNSINSYNNQRHQTESHQTLAIPVKEIGKDYVTLPVAVETDEDKVLTPQDINEIEKEVLKAIPESLGNPDIMYESAIPLDELSSPGQYMIQEALSNSYGGGNHGGKGNSGGNRWPKIPKFMSALSPSKVKISDLLKPLLRKVRPGPLPPSPGHQLHGMSPAPGYGGGGGKGGGGGSSKGSNAPMIPAGTPYSNTGHRPENLDVIHLIAGPAANSYQPAVIHVSQLVRHKNRGPISGGKRKKMRNKKKSQMNHQFNPYPGFEGAAAPPAMSFAQYQSSPFGGNGNPFSSPGMMNPYPSNAQYPGMRPSAPGSGPNYGQQQPGIKEGGMTKYQVINGNHQESYEINHGSPQSNGGYNTQSQVMTGYSGPSTGNNNYEEMISISMPPNPPSASYGQSYSELANMPPQPFQHVNQRPQPSHQSSSAQSYGSSQGNQKEYIEVINLPPRGSQSVDYNPGPTPSTNGYNSGHNNGNQQQSANYLESQGQGQSGSGGYNQGGSGQSGQSYSAASSIPSSGYGDQSSNNNPSYESNHNSAPSSTSYGGGSGGPSGATIELIDGSTSPNFNYKGVTSLNPKELVELIAKQVPSLKDVLTPGHSNSPDQGSGYDGGGNKNQGNSYQSQNGGGPDVSYEVIQMPPIYHNAQNQNTPQEQQDSNYNPAVNYAGMNKGQESGESSYEGGGNGERGSNSNNNYQPSSNGYTQESSYSSHQSSHSSSSSDQSSYQPPYESPSSYDQQNQNLKSPSVQYSSSNVETNSNNNYRNHNYDSSNNNHHQYPDESQRSNIIASQGSSSVQLPSSSSSSSTTSSHGESHPYKFGQRLTSSEQLSSSSSSAEETLSQPSSPSSGSESVLSQLYSSSNEGGRVNVSPVKVLTKESEDDEFKEDSNLAGLLLSESSHPSSLPSSSSSSSSSSSEQSQSDDTMAKSK